MILHHGDCLDVLKTIPDNSIDSLLTDPPAGISFMGKDWDHNKGGRTEWIKWMSEIMSECLRVLKPGAHGLVWAIPRTSHWTATALEDAGFEVRDVITHLFGSGFPKSLNVPKQIEKEYLCQFKSHAKDAEIPYQLIPVELNAGKIAFVAVYVQTQQGEELVPQTVIGVVVDSNAQTGTSLYATTEPIDLSTTLLLRKILEESLRDTNKCITLMELKTIIDLKIWNLLQFQNTLNTTISLNGTSLKPASEHWILVRKPIAEKTVASNVLEWGTGGINIDASRIDSTDAELEELNRPNKRPSSPTQFMVSQSREFTPATGRFPANLVFSHTPWCTDEMCDIECAIERLNQQSGILKSGRLEPHHQISGSSNMAMSGANQERRPKKQFGGDVGGASRFFYCSKISPSERGDSKHPTMKSQKLMRYFCKMITPPNGVILDPFMGSGSTGLAAKSEGFDFIGIEKEKDYFDIASKRINP